MIQYLNSFNNHPELSNFAGDFVRKQFSKYIVGHKTSDFKSLDPIHPPCKKTMYDSLEDAREMIRHIKENRIIRDLEAYQCPACGMWHLTSKSK